MFDAGLRSEPGQQPRARGAASVTAVRRGDVSRLGDLAQAGSAKILLPRGRGPALEAVLLNTGGGLTGGDRFSWDAAAGKGADLVMATQAAERVYRARACEIARVDVRLRLGQGARLHWLPQETILYDRGALMRRLEVEMAEDAELIAVESVVLGRAAMGERVASCRFSDQWRIRRGGRLVYAEALRIWGDVAEALGQSATLRETRAFATVLVVAQDAEDRTCGVRAWLKAEDGVAAGASGFDNCLAVRMLAQDGYLLRPALARLLAHLGGRDLPRVWTI